MLSRLHGKWATQLLNLVSKESQHHEHDKYQAQVLLTKTIVVLVMVSLVLRFFSVLKVSWRVDRGNFTPGPSQNDAGASRLTPLPSSKRANHPSLPVGKQLRLPLCDSFQEETCPRLMTFEPPELPHGPGNQRLVEMPQHRVHCRRAVLPIIRQPAPEHRVVHSGNLVKTQVRTIVRGHSQCATAIRGQLTWGLGSSGT